MVYVVAVWTEMFQSFALVENSNLECMRKYFLSV